MNPDPKTVLCLQYHEADKARAMRLAKLIADIEPEHRDDVEFLFVARYDCEHDHEVIAQVMQKFQVNWITTQTKWAGWPGGPNGCALDLLEWLAFNRREAGAAILIEPDCVPASLFWIDSLISEWRRHPDAWMMGAWRPSGGEHGHINGNCVIRPDLAAKVDVSRIITPPLAWDCALAPYTRKHWHITGLIKNRFESTGATPADFATPDIGDDPPVLIHGYKDTSAIQLAEQLLLKPQVDV